VSGGDRGRPPLVSVVTTAYDEEENLRELYERVRKTLETLDLPFELVVVDNGSRDNSLTLLRELRAADPRVAWVSLSRNFGHQGGLIAALDMSRGDVVISMDADLQHPPEAVADLITRWREGYEVVHAIEREMPGRRSVRRWLGDLFYRLFDRLSGFDLETTRADFRLLDRQVVDVLCGLPERQKFIRGLVRWLGYRQTTVPYDLAPRARGESKFRYRHLFTLALDAILSFSVVPLRALAVAGLVLAVPAFAYSLVAIAYGLYALVTGNYQVIPPGWASIVAAIMFFGGVQLVGLGLLGEYLGRVYHEAKGRPAYVVREAALERRE
jgi:glycosyltransferase involved in cell wall biosynthesis